MTQRKITNLLLVFAAFLSSTTLRAQTLGIVEQRLDRLEESVKGLQSKKGGSRVELRQAPEPTHPAASEEALVTLGNRLASLEQQVSGLVAAQEQDRRTLVSGIERLDRLKGDVEARVDGIEQQVANLAAATKLSPVGTASPKVQSPDDRYLEALGFAERNEWSKAEFAFDTFIANNPMHARILDARYWLGRSFLGEAKPAQAAQVFLELFEKHPDASFAVDNLFALAEALMAVGPENAAQACAVYDQIDGSYAAKLAASQRDRLLDLRVKQNCK